MKNLNFQEMIERFLSYWGKQGCYIEQPYDIEVGAGTMHPATFFKALGKRPCRVVYVQPSRRPSDGRYGDNPTRVARHFQLQVILKPSPENSQELFINSLTAIGIKVNEHDIRFIQDDWEAPTLGAWGMGWEVRLSGLEITQFTYFQQMGGFDLFPVSVEITYGLERIALFLQEKDSIFDLMWSDNVTYGDLHLEAEREFSDYNFKWADVNSLFEQFKIAEKECKRLISLNCCLPAYDYVLKMSHIFNLLDSREAISVSERAVYIGKVRNMARKCAEIYVNKLGE